MLAKAKNGKVENSRKGDLHFLYGAYKYVYGQGIGTDTPKNFVPVLATFRLGSIMVRMNLMIHFKC